MGSKEILAAQVLLPLVLLSPSPLRAEPISWKKGDMWRIVVDRPSPDGGEQASGRYEIFVGIGGSDVVDSIDCWKFTFTLSKDTPAPIAGQYYNCIGKAAHWPRKVMIVKDRKVSRPEIIERLGDISFIKEAIDGFPIEIVPPMQPLVLTTVDATATFSVSRHRDGKYIVMQTNHKIASGKEVQVRQKWIEGEKWWREYERFVDGRRDLHARLWTLTPEQQRQHEENMRHLSLDKRLHAIVPVYEENPNFWDIMQRLRDGTGLEFTVDKNLDRHEPVLGSVQFPKSSAWMVMNMMARIDLEDGHWEKVDNGYRLVAIKSLRERPEPRMSATQWLLISAALLGAVLLAVALLAYRRHRVEQPKAPA